MATEFATSGAEKLISAERRVQEAISKTARIASQSVAKTKQWMDRNKTALTAIGIAAGGAMAAIISQTPELVAGLSETQLYFSMFAMELGQTWSPALEGFNGLLEAALGWFEKLPDPVKELVGGLTGIGLALLVAIPAIALFVWSLGTIAAAVGGLTFTTALGGLTLLGAAVGIVGGLLIGGVVVWALWRTGVLKAIEEAGARVGQFAYNAGVVFGNLKDNILEWLGLVAASAGLWGAQFALNWIDGIVSNIPFLGDLLGPKIDSLKGVLDQAGADLQKQWDEWNSSGGFRDGLTEGVVTPSWANDPSQMEHPVTDWMNSLFGGAPGAGDTGQTDRLSQILPDFEMPAGYSDALMRLQEIQTQSEALDRTASTTASNVSASMETMAVNVAGSSQSVSTTTESAAGDVATTFDSLVSRSPKWGSDLMGLFVVGLNSQYPALLSAVARIRSTIESALSFDIATNDRAAMRWGSDLVEMFGTGMRQAMPMMAIPSPVPALAAAGGGGGGGTVYNITVPVEVQVNGAEARSFDERKIAALVRDEIAGALRSRGR